MVVALTLAAAGGEGVPSGNARVRGPQAVVYEAPSRQSAALRRLYLGEIVEVIEQVQAEDEAWAKVALGPQRSGYVLAQDVMAASLPPAEPWQEKTAIRDERPLAVAIKGLGESLGAGIWGRYQPFTRLGATLTLGTIIDRGAPHGTTLSGGLTAIISLWNLSPVVEMGWAILTYERRQSRLRVNAIYATAGLEWIFDWGGLVAFSATYLRSVDMEISHPYEAPPPPAESYGMLDPGERRWLQMLRPELRLGYAF